MPQPRRMAVDGTKQRELLVQAAEELLLAEGYGAISARRVTAKAGLKSQLLYYYFETMDDLIVAVVQRTTSRREARFEQALASANPLRAIWELDGDPAFAALSAELISIARHREAVRTQITRNAAAFRARQVEVVARLLREKGVELHGIPPAALVMVATAVTRTINTEASLGLHESHEETLCVLRSVIGRYCGPEAA